MKRVMYKNPGLAVLVHWGIFLVAIICLAAYTMQQIVPSLWVGIAMIIFLLLSIVRLLNLARTLLNSSIH